MGVAKRAQQHRAASRNKKKKKTIAIFGSASLAQRHRGMLSGIEHGAGASSGITLRARQHQHGVAWRASWRNISVIVIAHRRGSSPWQRNGGGVAAIKSIAGNRKRGIENGESAWRENIIASSSRMAWWRHGVARHRQKRGKISRAAKSSRRSTWRGIIARLRRSRRNKALKSAKYYRGGGGLAEEAAA